MHNVATDALANVAARLSPLRDNFFEILYKPSIPYNITNLRIFNDDQQILHFMENVDVQKVVVIDENEHERALRDGARVNKENPIPKGMVSLEKSYDLKNLLRGLVNTKTHSSTLSHEQINLGTDNYLNFFNIDT